MRNRSLLNNKERQDVKGGCISTARWALSITVDTVKMRNKAILGYNNHQKERTGSGKLAHVSTVRKLIRMIYYMLSNRKPWKY